MTMVRSFKILDSNSVEPRSKIELVDLHKENSRQSWVPKLLSICNSNSNLCLFVCCPFECLFVCLFDRSSAEDPDRSGLVWSGLVWSGLVWSGLVRF